MIVFTIRLVVRSMRWVAPLLLVLIGMFVVLGGNGTGLTKASSTFAVFLAFGVWITVVAGNVDDDAHRELLAVATGTPTRLHRIRAVSAIVLAVPVVAVSSAVLAAATTEPQRSSLAVMVVVAAVQISAVLIGAAIGTWLHRPILRHRGLTPMLAVLAMIAALLATPTTHLHRSLDRGQASTAAWYLTAATAVSIGSVTAASTVTRRRAR